MANRSWAQELGDLLERLKVRSGRSYETIGRKINASKSSAHRYCTGASVPQEFGILERIGLTCGASRDEMVRLHELWILATNDTDNRGQSAIAAENLGKASPTAELPHASVQPNSSSPIRGRRRLSALVRAGLVVSLTVVLTSSGPLHQIRSSPLAAQWFSGPAWTLPAAPVPSTFFGVTINSGTGLMPAFRVGAVRLWDSGTRWSEIQPQRAEFDWSVLDREVGNATDKGLPVLFVLGGTPRWASPDGSPGPYPDGSTSAPPDSLADWDTFVRMLVQRYRGRIEAYELWVLGNDRRFYSGSVETLVDMTRRASRIVRSMDPKATVVCPGMGQLWNSEGVQVLQRFAELGGYSYCDVASVKLFQKSSADPPETMLDLTARIDHIMHEVGIHPRIWNTGTTYTIALQSGLDETKARNYAVRFFLVGLYARNLNLERMYFYNWGGTKIPVVLQAVGGEPTQAALAVEQLQRWLAHAQSRSCGHGMAIGLPDNLWDCEFSVTEPDGSYGARVLWTSTGTAQTTAKPGDRAIRKLDGTATTVRPGDTIIVTEEPILVENGAPAPN